MGKKELFDMEAKIIAQTKKAWLLDDGKTQAWVPKSQAQDNEDGTFTMPEAMAIDKGFA